MRRRNVIVNAVLVVAIVVVATVAYLTVHKSTKAQAATRTTTVRRGDVIATVAASGNVTSAVNTSLSFSDCTGTLTKVLVEPGQKVRSGQKLASVDSTDAATADKNALSSLKAATTSASQALSAATTSLDNAVSSYNLDLSQADSNIATAQDTVDSDETLVGNAKSALDTAQDGTDTQKISSAQSAYDNAEKQLTQDRAAVKNLEQQRAKTTLNDQSQINSARTALTSTRSSSSQANTAVSTARTTLSAARTTLASCTLTAPKAGTVTAVNASVGETPSGSTGSSSTGSSSTGASSTGSSATGSSGTSSSSTTGSSSSAFITLVDMDDLVIDTSISEADVASVKVGQSASVVFSALTSPAHRSGTTVTGKVTAIDPTSTVTSSVVTYGATVTLSSPPAGLRLGQTGTVTVTTAHKTNVLYISTTAITTTGVGKTVTLSSGNATHAVRITTGVAGDATTEVTSGLTAGQTIVLPSTTSASTTNGGIPGTGGFGGTR